MRSTLFLVLLQFSVGARALDLTPISSPFMTMTEAAGSISMMAKSLRDKGDHRALFAAIYAITIEATDKKFKSFEDRTWTSRLVVNYANLYRRNLLLELSGERRNLPLSWRLSFTYSEQNRNWSPTLDLIYGIHVHIVRDLVEALLVTPGRLIGIRKRDFLKINEALTESMPKIWKLYASYGAESVLNPSFERKLMLEWILRMRSEAWDNAKSVKQLGQIDQQQRLLLQLDEFVYDREILYGVATPTVQ